MGGKRVSAEPKREGAVPPSAPPKPSVSGSGDHKPAGFLLVFQKDLHVRNPLDSPDGFEHIPGIRILLENWRGPLIASVSIMPEGYSRRTLACFPVPLSPQNTTFRGLNLNKISNSNV